MYNFICDSYVAIKGYKHSSVAQTAHFVSTNKQTNKQTQMKHRESYWIFELDTVMLSGLIIDD